MGLTGHSDHVAKRGLNPTRPQQAIPAQITRRASQDTGESGAERAGRIEPRLVLRRHHLAAIGQRLEPFAKPTLAGDFEKCHAEMPLEAAPHCRKIITHFRDMALRPAPVGPFIECVQQALDRWIARRGRLHGVAPLARPKPRFDTRPDCRPESAVLRQRLARRTGQPAENPRRGHADISLPVVACIALKQRPVKCVMVWKVEQHVTLIPSPRGAVSRKSGVY